MVSFSEFTDVMTHWQICIVFSFSQVWNYKEVLVRTRKKIAEENVGHEKGNFIFKICSTVNFVAKPGNLCWFERECPP